jgi:hypothetical protein
MLIIFSLVYTDDIRRSIEMKNLPPGGTTFNITLEKAGGNSVPDIAETYLTGNI